MHKAAAQVFDNNAQVYQDKYMDVSLYHDALDRFCAVVKQGCHILEVACGPGNITKYLLSKRPDFHILATDLSPNMLKLAKANNPQVTFQQLDVSDIHSIGKKFDAVVAGFVFPYLSAEEVTQFIDHTAQLLHTGGVLYISTIEDSYENSALQTAPSGDTVYMYYYEEPFLRQTLEENGFNVADVQHLQYFAANGSTVSDIVLVAQL